MRYDEKPMRAMMTWTRLLTPYPPPAAFPTRRYGSRFAQPANTFCTVGARGALASRGA